MSEFRCFVCQENLEEIDFGGFIREYELVLGGTARGVKICRNCISSCI